MAVVRRGQAEVPQRLGSIARLLQRTQHQAGDDVLLRRAAGSIQHRLQGLGGDFITLESLDGVAEVRQERCKRVQLFGIGILVHAVENGQLFLFGKARHALVGLEHEFLDQFVGGAVFFALDGGRYAALVQRDDCLVNIQIQRAALKTRRTHLLRHIVHAAQRLRQFRRKAGFVPLGQQARYIVVDQPRVGMNH